MTWARLDRFFNFVSLTKILVPVLLFYPEPTCSNLFHNSEKGLGLEDQLCIETVYAEKTWVSLFRAYVISSSFKIRISGRMEVVMIITFFRKSAYGLPREFCPLCVDLEPEWEMNMGEKISSSLYSISVAGKWLYLFPGCDCFNFDLGSSRHFVHGSKTFNE